MSTITQLVDHLFRHQAGRMTSTLTRLLGTGRLDLIEEVVQESLIRALRLWPYRGVPSNPEAWLMRVAKNRAIDRLRREKMRQGKEEQVKHWSEQALKREPDWLPTTFADEVEDDLLRMMFTCSHPALPRAARLTLTLKAVGGFSVDEIARALPARKSTVAQRLVRAKRKIREEQIPFQVPEPARLGERLDSVLEVVYLIFNEGYAPRDGENLVRRDLCDEALRLVDLLAQHPKTGVPKVWALASLLYLQSSRIPARLKDGELVLLPEQDRSLWDRARMARGTSYLEKALSGDELTAFHIQAAIAAHHAASISWEETDWKEILTQYDLLMQLDGSPIAALNRAVALSFVQGPERALEELQAIRNHAALRDYSLLPATEGEFHSRSGDYKKAADCYRQALRKSCSEPERRFLGNRLRLAESRSKKD